MGRRGDGFGPGIQAWVTVNAVPIIFTIFYGVLLLYYILRAILNRSQVFIILSLFCAIRVTAFVIYAAISNVKSFVSNPGSVTLSIFLSVGFSALLYSAYALVLERGIASGNVVKNPITRVTSNRYLICFALAVAVAIGLATFVCGFQKNMYLFGAGSVYVYNNVDMCTFALHETYVVIILAITVLMGVQVVFQVMGERRGTAPTTPSGKAYKTYIPCLVLILLLIHEIYFFVSINLHSYSQVLWWTLWALPELLAVFLFAVPDLVPKRKILDPHAHKQESDAS